MLLRYMLIMALYITAIYVGSEKMLVMSDVLLSQGNVSVLDKREERVKPRTFSRSEIKLVSSDPSLLDIATNFEESQNLSGLFYDPQTGESGEHSSTIQEAIAMLQHKKMQDNIAIANSKNGNGSPPAPPENIPDLEVYIDALFDNGAIVNGAFVKIGQALVKEEPESLLVGTRVHEKLLQIKRAGKIMWVDVTEGKILL